MTIEARPEFSINIVKEARPEFSTLLVKPNAVKLGLIGILRQELIESGYDIVAEEVVEVKRNKAVRMYEHLGEKRGPVIDHIVSGPSYVFVVYGLDVIHSLRDLAGSTAWKERPAKGLRGKYAQDFIQNSVHTPDSHKESVEHLRLLVPRVVQELLRTQLADDLYAFLTDEEGIKNGKRFVNQYAQ